MKKTLFLLCIFAVVVVAIINYKTPLKIRHSGDWSIGFGHATVFGKIPLKHNGVYSLEKLRKLSSETRFLADPFFISVEDTFYLFFEHQPMKGHAHIGLMTSVDGINYEYKGTVLKEKFHLSYPQVFRHKNEYFMLPESQGAGAVLLYKANRFPFDWKVCDTLIDNIKLKDPTVYLSDSLNILVGTDSNLQMKMYHADSLSGNWKLHKKHTVITGSESRPGGRIFADRNGLLLPVQNSSAGYGTGLSLYRLADFKNDNYTITKVKHMLLKGQPEIPEFNAGMHHLDFQHVGNRYYCVYDGKRFQGAKSRLNIAGALKMSCLDSKFWLLQTFR